MKTTLAYILVAFATLLYVLSFITPWWWWNWAVRADHRTNCFIDGTCRNNDIVFKNNGDAQSMWDAVLSLMVLSLIPFIAWMHLMIMQRSRRYGDIPHRKAGAIISGIFAFILILTVVIAFAAGINHKYGVPGFYGHRNCVLRSNPADLPSGDGIHCHHYSWGGNAGWYFALFTLVPLLAGIILSILAKEKTTTTRGAVVHEKVTTTTTTAPAYATTTGPISA